jgi:hypothetical protein
MCTCSLLLYHKAQGFVSSGDFPINMTYKIRQVSPNILHDSLWLKNITYYNNNKIICYRIHRSPTYQTPPQTWRQFERNQPLPYATTFADILLSSAVLVHGQHGQTFLCVQFSEKDTLLETQYSGEQLLRKQEQHVATINFTKHLINFMFGWPCISNYICIINQHDALFIFILLNYHASTCFGPACSPSSAGSKCMCGKLYQFSSKSPVSRPG